MATNASPFIVNIVPLQGIATGITTNSDTAQQLTILQTDVTNIQSMVNYDTRTISADFITSFTQGNTIQFTENINLSSVSLFSEGSEISLNSGTFSTIRFAKSSFISGNLSTMTFVTAGNENIKINYTDPSNNTGATVNIAGNLKVSQDAYVRTLYQTSDRNQKSNILPFSTCLDDILKIQPCSFTWNNTGEQDIGFIAQDIHESWPSLTKEGESIAYSRFIPLLLEGIRELDERVRKLEGLRNN